MSLKLIQLLTILIIGILSRQVVALEEESSNHNAFLFGLSPHLTKEREALWRPLLKYIEKQKVYQHHPLFLFSRIDCLQVSLI